MIPTDHQKHHGAIVYPPTYRKKGKVEHATTPIITDKPKTLGSKNASRDTTSHRPIDPVVARLKEKRRLEKEEKERVAREKRGLKPVQRKATTSKAGPRSGQQMQQKPSQRNPPARVPPRPTPQPPKKLLNYAELMKKASGISKEKLSINLLNKSKSPEAEQQRKIGTPPPSRAPSSSSSSSSSTRTASKPIMKQRSSVAPPSSSKPPVKKPVVRAPLPTRQPSSKIKERLESKKKAQTTRKEYDYDDDDDDDLDSFVEDDEEDYGYDDTHRSEIWAMFNKGRKRSYYADDYDSDDMEATGAEIFDEEFQSRIDAEREDRREMEEEKRLQALKRKRLNR